MPADDAYSRAGVSIDAGNETVRRIAPLAAATHATLSEQKATLLSGIGGFAAAVALPSGMRQPVLISATDGVGTKLELACEQQRAEIAGRDVVAMCVNDLLCAGAQPLFFLDYFACGKLTPAFTAEVVGGVAAACQEAGCALIGGETAEMPGVYEADKFDIAGFAVGVAEKEELLSPHHVGSGDALIAIASNGAHSNGYSLIRRLLRDTPALAQTQIDGEQVVDLLLRPTRLYCRAVAALRADITIHGLAHITGGGLYENLERALPVNTDYTIDRHRISLPPLFQALQTAGDLAEVEMRRVFNCGIGMVVVVAAEDADIAVRTLTDAGEHAWQIGRIE